MNARETTSSPRVDIKESAYLAMFRDSSTTAVLDSILRGTIKYYECSINLPRLLSSALVMVDLGLSSEGGKYVTNYYKQLVTVQSAKLINQKDWYINPGEQNHLFDLLKGFYTFTLEPSSQNLNIKIILPLILESYTFSMSLIINIIEYVIR